MKKGCLIINYGRLFGLGALGLLLVLANTASAHISGTVFCDANGNGTQDTGEPGISGVTIVICNGDTVTTDADGKYFYTPPPPSIPCDVSVDLNTVPPNCQHECPTTVVVTNYPFADDVNFCFQGCCAPPPCPKCVDPQLGLGAAAGCTVLELGASSVSITGPAGGILGDVCIAPNGKLSMSGDEYVTGAIRLGPGAQFQNSSHFAVNVQNNVDLSAEIAAAYAAYTNAANMPCTQTFNVLDGKSVTTITGGPGINVICVKDISLSGKQLLLTGPPSAKFIFNISGKLVLTGGGLGPQIRVDSSAGLLPSAVLYNLLGTGQDVAFSGGGGGVSCCAAVVDGTILAPFRKIALSPGLVNGQIISGMNISIVSGSSVRCPPCD
jgi:SdrD B-like domain/Putative Ice-binding-like adhesive domain